MASLYLMIATIRVYHRPPQFTIHTFIEKAGLANDFLAVMGSGVLWSRRSSIRITTVVLNFSDSDTDTDVIDTGRRKIIHKLSESSDFNQ